MKKIPLTEIGYDPDFYPRVNGKEDWRTVFRYSDALLADPARQLPPIVVVVATAKAWAYMLLDGLHRIRAYYRAGRESIPAVVERLPRSKWFARSVELNAAHGRPLDSGDRAYIATRLRKDGYDAGQVAALLQMRVESLEKIVAGRVCRISAKASKSIPGGRGNRKMNGEHYGFLKAPFAGSGASPATAEAALAAQGPVSAMDAAHVLDSAIAVLECGVDLADEDIAARVQRLHTLTTPRG
jgi:hypothetical protein